ncbi:hypothetical protein PFICI_14695 [Pestalotiopsis fici W106-1]|uniref:NACHT domain-containing protein n=1 Tax=Pestalotiopsis fici (strain W106-1 / CGMCC3.15140) TaxID=1229662 RepID=W3WJ16_PESFW|nr:uncharacterized protein PFICI_14695 [Pestalotiopsis fici W106-1]ETS73749.1 hypothetical protein PFICI_14695 [Pestalotiopsis fici W106-1]
MKKAKKAWSRLKRSEHSSKSTGNALQVQGDAGSQPLIADAAQQGAPHLESDTSPPSLHEASDHASRIWEQAYKALRIDDSGLLGKFEDLMAYQIATADTADSNKKVPATHDTVSQEDMLKIIASGLDKTEKLAKRLQNAKEITGPILKFKETIGGVISLTGDPIATSACTSVFLGLSLIVEPLEQNEKNRSGMIYILSRLEWYSAMIPLLLDISRSPKRDDNLERLSRSLESGVTSLYKAMISYSIRAVLSYHRQQGYNFLRGALGLDDWQGALKTVKDAEELVERDSEKFNDFAKLSHLKTSAETRERQLNEVLAGLQAVPTAIERQTAKQQEWRMEDEDMKCLRALRGLTVASRDEVRTIESRKEPLLAEACQWVLDTEEYKTFINNDEVDARLLWVRGGPGAGKTMLTMGIMRDITESMERPDADDSVLSFFFAQSAEDKHNKSTAIVGGLVWHLADQKKHLVSHLRAQWDSSGESLFTDSNAFAALSKILQNMVEDVSLPRVVLIVDALDECEQGLDELIGLIANTVQVCPRVKIMVTSRPLSQNNENTLRKCRATHVLELDNISMSSPVNSYIDHKVGELQMEPEQHASIKKRLKQNAGATFLWVALVFQRLKQASPHNYSRILDSTPNSLSALYDEILGRIDAHEFDAQNCIDILKVAAVALDSLTIAELGAQAQLNWNVVPEIVRLCGPLLLIREDKLYFVHLSAKEHVFTHFGGENTGRGHEHMAERCMMVMQQHLKKNVCNLAKPSAEPPWSPWSLSLELDPLLPLRYSCIHWVDHFYLSENEVRGLSQMVYNFLKEKFLNWIEALSLLQQYVVGSASVEKLILAIKAQTVAASEIMSFLKDAHRFLLFHRQTIEHYPLQIYISALIFSPMKSVIRETYASDIPDWIVKPPSMPDEWDPHVQTMELEDLAPPDDHFHGGIGKVATFPSGGLIACLYSHASSGYQQLDFEEQYKDVTVVRLNGERLYTCHHHHDVQNIAFLPNGKLVSSTRKNVFVWNRQGQCESSYNLMETRIEDRNKLQKSLEKDSVIHEYFNELCTFLEYVSGSGNDRSEDQFSQEMIVNNEGEIMSSRIVGNILRVWSKLDVMEDPASFDLPRLTHSNAWYEHRLTYNSRVVLWQGYRLFQGVEEDLSRDGGDYDLHVVDLSDKSIISLHRHTAPVYNVSCSRNGRMASASLDGTLNIWDSSGHLLHTLECGSYVTGMSLLENDNFVTLHRESKRDQVYFWSPDGQRQHGCTIKSLWRGEELFPISQSENEKRPLLGVRCSKEIEVVDANLMQSTEPSIRYCIPIFQTQKVVLFLQNGSIKLVDVNTHSTTLFRHTTNYVGLGHLHSQVSPDGKLLCCVEKDLDNHILRVFELLSGQELYTFTTKLWFNSALGEWSAQDSDDCQSMSSRSQITFSGNNQFMAWRTYSGIMRVDLDTGGVFEVKTGDIELVNGSHIALSPDGRYAAIGKHEYYEGCVCFYDMQDGELVQSIPLTFEWDYLSWSANGHHLIICGLPSHGDPTFIILDTKSLQFNDIRREMEEGRSSFEKAEKVPQEIRDHIEEHHNTAFGFYLSQAIPGTSQRPKFRIVGWRSGWIQRNGEDIIHVPERYYVWPLVRIGGGIDRVDMAGLTREGQLMWFTFSNNESEFQQWRSRLFR